MSLKFLMRNMSIDLHTCQQVAEVFLLPGFFSREARVFLYTSFRRFQHGCLLGNVILFVATTILETLLRLCGIFPKYRCFTALKSKCFQLSCLVIRFITATMFNTSGGPSLEDL